MTIMEMLGQSGVLTVLGVGTVFTFLVLMVISVMLMGKIFRALGLSTDTQEPAASGGTAGNSAANSGPAIAAITAAVKEYEGTK